MKQWKPTRGKFQIITISHTGVCNNEYCKRTLVGKYKIIVFERPGSKIQAPVCMRCFFRFQKLPKDQQVIDVCPSDQQRHIPATPMVREGMVSVDARRSEANDQADAPADIRQLHDKSEKNPVCGGIQSDTHKQDGVDGVLPGQ